jgi:hypothetical protein
MVTNKSSDNQHGLFCHRDTKTAGLPDIFESFYIAVILPAPTAFVAASTRLRPMNINQLQLILLLFVYLVPTINAAHPLEEKYDVDAKKILTGDTPAQKIFTLRKYDFIHNALYTVSAAAKDQIKFESFSGKTLPLFLSKEDLQKLAVTNADPLEDVLRKKMDLPATTKLNGLLAGIADAIRDAQKRDPDAPPLIPTDLEIDILKVLWLEKAATSSEIYGSLDSVALRNSTSQDIQNILQKMTERGFLDRKKISPSHKFMFFGIAGVEVSSKNRKNKLYLYWPVVSLKRMLSHLDTQRYLALASSEKQDPGIINPFQKKLEEKIYRIVQ